MTINRLNELNEMAKKIESLETEINGLIVMVENALENNKERWNGYTIDEMIDGIKELKEELIIVRTEFEAA